jgi:hypothetical protein
MSSELHAIAAAVLRLAEKQGFVAPRDIRTELTRAGQPESRWKEVVELLRESLHFRQGRYYILSAAGSPQLQQQKDNLQQIRDILKEVLGEATTADSTDRRQEPRVPFSRPVKIIFENNQDLMVLGLDLSPSGIRFIANRSLLGRKFRVELPLPGAESAPPVTLLVRVLWTSAVADGLFENGGAFLEMISDDPSPKGPPASP